LSARLDGEDDPAERSVVDEHLAGCRSCARWLDTAAEVTRMARMSSVGAGPGVSDEVLLAAPGPSRRRLADGLRLLLGVLALAQFGLGMAQLSLYGGHDHTGLGAGPADSSHLWHESAAWNVAIGAGFGWIAVRRTRSAGLIPVLSAFVAILTLVSAGDVLQGQVDRTRLLSHGLVVAGYLVMLALTRPAFDFGDPPSGRLPTPGWRARFDEVDGRPAPLRVLPRSLPAQTARHDKAA